MTFDDDVHRPAPPPASGSALPVRDPHRYETGAGDPAQAFEPIDTGGLHELPSTDDPALNSLLAELSGARGLSLEDQLPIIEAVHRGLQDRLADTEG